MAIRGKLGLVDLGADDMDAILNPGVARVRSRDRERLEQTRRAWAAIRRASESFPSDLTRPEPAWERELAEAFDFVLRAEWPDDRTTPDGVGGLLLSRTPEGVEIDALLFLLPDGKRRVRAAFHRDGGCEIRVAVAAESAQATDRLDPRRSIEWDFVVTAPSAD